MKTLGKLGLGALSGVALAAAGMGYETVATRRDDKRFPGMGTRIDVDGVKLHARVMGAEHRRGPTVVFESGLSTPLEAWDHIQAETSRIATTVSYDRAGLGWSGPGPLPRTAERVTGELAELLSILDCPRPFVLAGHSYGGLLARCFAHRFPDQVAGLVLIDSSHPDQFRRSVAQRMGLPMMRSSIGQSAFWAPVGVTRLLTTRQTAEPFARLSAEHQAAILARTTAAHNRRGTRDEVTAWLETVNAEARDTVVPPGCRLSVISAGKVAASDPVHDELQRELAGLADGSKHVLVADADHMELLTWPEHARVVAEVIGETVSQVRQQASGESTEIERSTK